MLVSCRSHKGLQPLKKNKLFMKNVGKFSHSGKKSSLDIGQQDLDVVHGLTKNTLELVLNIFY